MIQTLRTNMTSHYLLSETQEHDIYQVRQALAALEALADAVPIGCSITLSPEQVSCLIGIIRVRLPTAEQMPFKP